MQEMRQVVSKAKRCKMLFLYKQPSASKRQCPGEALLLVVKVVLVVFLTQPNDNEDIKWTKINLVVKYCKSCIGCLLSMSSSCHRIQRKSSHLSNPSTKRKIMDEKKRQVWRFVIQTAISILTAIATALGVTSCMAAV